MSSSDGVKDSERQPLVVKKATSSYTTSSSSFSSVDVPTGGDDHDTPKVGLNDWLSDASDTFFLSIPIFCTMLSWVGMKTTDSALLGHVSANALAASSLSDLWTMCTGVLIQGRILGVLCGAALGAGNPKLVGIYLQVSYYVLCWFVLLVGICWYCTEYVGLWFGTDPQIASMAGYYAKVLAWSLPGQMFFSQLTQFFSSQRIMHPEVNASVVGLVTNFIFGLIFVLGIPVPHFDGYGFSACPIVTTTVVYVQIFIVTYVYMYRQRLHETCWDGWNYQEITYERIRTYLDLYIPAVLGVSSDFWRMAFVGAVAAKLGTNELAVFNTSYRILWITLVLVNSVSSAASIKMTIRLGQSNPSGAKRAGEVGIILSIMILAVISTFVFFKIRWFGSIFTNDPVLLQLFVDSKLPLTLGLFFMNLSVAIEKIPYSMGRTKEVFWYGFIASWFGQVPAVLLLTTYWRHDLVGVYSGMTIGYCVLTVLYTYLLIKSDWTYYSEMARRRSEVNKIEE